MLGAHEATARHEEGAEVEAEGSNPIRGEDDHQGGEAEEDRGGTSGRRP